ncbi:MAG TPA: amino acid ABC transporter permease [Acidimicrobiia bacterium]|nr:amino acid ABC transporter permease [Acidimicrobiia bacterium]
MTLDDTRPAELLGPAPEPPPEEDLSPSEWVRIRLFATWYDTLFTLLFGAGFVWAARALIRYLISADFTILRVNLALLMVGRFPRDQLWRPAVALILTGLLLGLLAGAAIGSARDRAAEAGEEFSWDGWLAVVRRFWPILAFIVLTLSFTQTVSPWLVAAATLAAGAFGHWMGRTIPAGVRRYSWLIAIALLVAAFLVLITGGVGWEDWGGLQLNIFLTVAGIALAFPLGLLLALGRRSSLPALQGASVTYIEFIRGVPLITLLLLGAYALGFMLPDSLQPSRTTRILIAIALFEAAYIAEVVRGGFNAVPPGQVEASQALGMPPWKTTRLIVLPQALRATIPAMVGQFISLYKDTTLVIVVALLDILAAAQASTSQPDFLAQGLHRVTLPFVGLAFWVGSYTMSREARRLEKRLGVGER